MTETAQRVIKFRAWHHESRRMFEVSDLDSMQGRAAMVRLVPPEGWDHSFTVPLHAVTLEQFTGLTDKNGREIYEGDVIRLSDGNLQVVEWFPDVAGFEPFVSVLRSDGPNFEVQESEVIGNIHETTDLVK